MINAEYTGETKDTILFFEQYRLCVEQASAVSAMRHQANGYFLTLHTVLAAGFGYLIESGILTKSSLAVYLIAIVILTMLCIIWFSAISYYGNLNGAKFEVILELEKHLPTTPFKEEWKKLGMGKRGFKFVPLSKLERATPLLFMVIYIAMSSWMVLSYVEDFSLIDALKNIQNNG